MGIEGCYGENWSDTHSNGWERQTSTAVSQTVGKGIAHTKTSIFQCPAPTHIRPEDMGGIYETQSKCWLYQWYTFVYDKENGNVAVLATYEYDIIEKPGNIPRCVPSQCDDSTDCQEFLTARGLLRVQLPIWLPLRLHILNSNQMWEVLKLFIKIGI